MDIQSLTRIAGLILVLTACSDGFAQVSSSVLLGDVTRDGVVNVIDAQQVLRYSEGLPVSFPIGEMICGRLSGDVDSDGEVDAADAEAIAEWSVGLDGAYPIGEPVAC